MKGQTLSDGVREHARKIYVEPARSRGDATVGILVKDVVRDLQLFNRTPLVCQALRSDKFLESNDLTIEKDDGPPSGLGTTVNITYRLGGKHEAQSTAVESPFLRARGVAKEVFASLGGGEAFIRAERAAWGDRRDS